MLIDHRKDAQYPPQLVGASFRRKHLQQAAAELTTVRYASHVFRNVFSPSARFVVHIFILERLKKILRNRWFYDTIRLTKDVKIDEAESSQTHHGFGNVLEWLISCSSCERLDLFTVLARGRPWYPSRDVSQPRQILHPESTRQVAETKTLSGFLR